MIPDDRKYSQEHEWVQVEGDIGTVGVTDHAAGELGDLVYVALPDMGAEFSAGDAVGSIPVSGEIVEINEALDGDPGQVNNSPMDDGWLFKVKLTDTGELDSLLDASGYEELLG